MDDLENGAGAGTGDEPQGGDTPVVDESAGGGAPVIDTPIDPIVTASPPVVDPGAAAADLPSVKIKLKATKFDVHNSQSQVVYRQNEVVEVEKIGNFERAQIEAGLMVQL